MTCPGADLTSVAVVELLTEIRDLLREGLQQPKRVNRTGNEATGHLVEGANLGTVMAVRYGLTPKSITEVLKELRVSLAEQEQGLGRRKIAHVDQPAYRGRHSAAPTPNKRAAS